VLAFGRGEATIRQRAVQSRALRLVGVLLQLPLH